MMRKYEIVEMLINSKMDHALSVEISRFLDKVMSKGEEDQVVVVIHHFPGSTRDRGHDSPEKMIYILPDTLGNSLLEDVTASPWHMEGISEVFAAIADREIRTGEKHVHFLSPFYSQRPEITHAPRSVAHHPGVVISIKEKPTQSRTK